MKPDWDKLAESFADSETQLIADVDCTAEGEPLCGQFGVEGFPTIKWGDPTGDMEDYEGGRDFQSLKTFADENLKPQCSVSNLELCDDEKKAKIKKFMDMPLEELSAAISSKEEEIAKLDSDFEAFIEGLQSQYEEMVKKVTEDKEEVKKSGLGLMKSVVASQAAKEDGTKDEL